MDWPTFHGMIPAANRSLEHTSPPGRISQVLAQFATVDFGRVPMAANIWYPGGYSHVGTRAQVRTGAAPSIGHLEYFRGYRYVDMDRCYTGNGDAFLSEANHCALMLLVDRQGPSHFLAHISTGTIPVNMQVDLQNFTQGINADFNRPVLHIFRGGATDNAELDIMMQLLSLVVSDVNLALLAPSTTYVVGENGNSWRAYSSVYLKHEANPHTLRVAFAR